MSKPAVLSVLLALVLNLSFTLSIATTYPPGSLEVLIDLENLPVINSNIRSGMFTSVDPHGHGRDHGNYLRQDGDEYILAEMNGPGVISRIWAANAQGTLRIYIDDRENPAVEMKFKDMFEDRFPPFVSPVSGKSSGGWYSYHPIAYAEYCKVAVTQDPELTAKKAEARKPKKVSIDVTGAKELKLIMNDAGDGFGNDHADWADAKLIRKNGTVLYLSDINDDTKDARLVLAKQGWGNLQRDKSVDGNPLSIGGKKYEKGLGSHTNGEIVFELSGEFEKFDSEVGLDDEVVERREGSIIFRVEVDGKQVWESDVLGFPRIEGELRPESLYYHINYETHPEGTKIIPFSRQLTPEQSVVLKRVVEIWSGNGILPTEQGKDDLKHEKTITVKGGSTETFAQFDGSGKIYSLKMRLKSSDKRAYRRTIIKMYWDGDPTPAVWAPYGDFFGSGFGHVEFYSLPYGMGHGEKMVKTKGEKVQSDIAGGEGYSYWIMPFARGARIVIENGSTESVEISGEILWRKIPIPAPDIGRFCAQWRNERATKDKLIELLDVKGTGKFVGVKLSIQGLGEISYLEGNEQYFIDGEEKPSMIGTGTEDLFSGGWYYTTGVFDRPLHGLTVKEEYTGRTSQYRLQIPDAVPFRTSFKMLIEHGHNNIYLDADYATMAYFYMLPPVAQQYTPPKASEMNFPRIILARPNLPGRGASGDNRGNIKMMRGGRFAEHVFDSVKASCSKSLEFWKDISEGYIGTNMAVFSWWPTTYLIRDENLDPRLKEPYRGDVIICAGSKAGDYLEIPLSVDDGAGMFMGRYWLVAGPDYGKVRINVGNVTIAKDVDLYVEEVQPAQIVSFGPLQLPAGQKNLRIEVTGKNEKSSGMKFGLYVEKTVRAEIMPEAWSIIGPFPFDITSPDSSFDTIYPPEKKLDFNAKYEGKQGEIGWQVMPARMVEEDDYRGINFPTAIPLAHGATAYATTFILSPDDIEATLILSHSRYVSILLNDEKVYERKVVRQYLPDQEEVKVKLKKGTNNLLIKTSNTQDEWKVGLRFTDVDGKPLSNIKFQRTE